MKISSRIRRLCRQKDPVAAPITHIVLARKAMPILDIQDEREFIVGTSFPDIRHLGVLERTCTHDHSKVLADVRGAPSSFMAGMLFHSLVDTVREEFMEENGLYEIIPGLPYMVVALKFYEDERLCNKVEDWAKIAKYFAKPLPEELAFGLSQKDVERWHKLIGKYCSQPPTSESRYALTTGMRSTEENKTAARVFEAGVEIIAKKHELVDPIIDQLYEQFVQIIQS